MVMKTHWALKVYIAGTIKIYAIVSLCNRIRTYVYSKEISIPFPFSSENDLNAPPHIFAWFPGVTEFLLGFFSTIYDHTIGSQANIDALQITYHNKFFWSSCTVNYAI